MILFPLHLLQSGRSVFTQHFRDLQRTSLSVPKPAAGSSCPQCWDIFWLQISGHRHTLPVFALLRLQQHLYFSSVRKKPNINITRLYTALISIFVIFKIVGKSCSSIQVGSIPLFICLGFNYLGRNLSVILGLHCNAVTKSVLGLFISKSVFCKAWHLHAPPHQGEF